MLDKFLEAAESVGMRRMTPAEFEEWRNQPIPLRVRARQLWTRVVVWLRARWPGEYRWQEGMGEISGFGGGYEDACRSMLRSGLRWLDRNPKADPQFRGYEGVYGIVTEDNEAAKLLSKAVVDGSGGDCTGAMHQAVVTACLWVRRNGWPAYVEAMSDDR